MSYNQFQWWRSSLKSHHRPLNSKSHSLLARIKHGDFDYPASYLNALYDIDLEIEKIKQSITSSYTGRSLQSLEMDIRDATRMKNVRRLKLSEEMYRQEEKILSTLRYELHAEFGVDLWNEIESGNHSELRSVEDVYKLYERKAAIALSSI